ncbi:dipeptide ABC transporter permease DppC [Mesorhizobium ephedrae]|jgi:dipeptide transport system permease protein|uniref:Dipeptide ABC transporter permease DppC n=1 Tax=Kumtagia ephedrae TaxID=2116701 RepID=A0A2P7RVE2_9HYPH|nr:dipeptide ABC transporter permease DppC [Mesorhizobium ephedrae]
MTAKDTREPIVSSSGEPVALMQAGPLREFWLLFRKNLSAMVGLTILLVFLFVAVFADLIAPHSPIMQFRQHSLQPPVWQDGGSARFLLGTDAVGRDLLSRLMHGSRFSFYVGFCVLTLSLTLGVALGLVAGYFRGWLEEIIMRLSDILWSFPSLLLAFVVVAVLGPSLTNAMIAIALAYLPEFIRITRGQVLVVANRNYVIASRMAGAGPLRLMFTAILPNCLAPVIVHASLVFSSAILAAAGLSFLGLGAQPPAPEWGAMLAESREFILRAWWVVAFPGLAILIMVLAVNFIGDGLRDALDPRLSRA